jgi:hypothetical protein
VKALYELEESEFSSDDSEADFVAPRTSCKALRVPCCAIHTVVKNQFQTFDDGTKDDEEDDVAEHVAALNLWAHKVTTRSSRPRKIKKSKPLKKIDVVIETEADLDVAIAENEIIRQRLPGIDANTMPLYATMIKRAPPADTLQPGEVWAMIDSGSGIDGMDIDAIFPDAKIEKTTTPITCVTANGEEMIADQVAQLHVSLDGQSCDIPFSKLPLTVPIISVRKHIHRGHRCRIHETGGYFRNTQTRKKARFIEKDGVYFMRLKVIGNTTEFPPLGFARQGTKS